ncbi:hypothetical protein CN380_07590 [Bacillus sp. AFS017274]|nr:hypothetical protein CN380_07590 [Bacillus sp. AFS017274]
MSGTNKESCFSTRLPIGFGSIHYMVFRTNMKEGTMFIQFPIEKRRKMIESIQEYVYQEQGKEIGEIAAENHLQFIFENIAPFIYNEGIKDAKKVIEDRLGNIEEDLYSLERPID